MTEALFEKQIDIPQQKYSPDHTNEFIILNRSIFFKDFNQEIGFMNV